MIQNGIDHKTSAPYHPATNEAAENTVKSLKMALMKAFEKNKSNDWNLILNRFLLDYRNTAHSTTGFSPAKLMLGRNLRSRLDLLRPLAMDVSNISVTLLDKAKLHT